MMWSTVHLGDGVSTQWSVLTCVESAFVMAGHSRPKDGVATLAYVPAIHALLWCQGVDARHKAGMTAESDASHVRILYRTVSKPDA